MAQADTHPDPPFRGRATIRDIADLAGVSIATVSRVLNDRPDVAPETRETVLQVVREHGFSTNRGARGLSSGRTGMIGLTLPMVADAYFGPILSGAAEALYERDMRIVLAPTLHEHDREVSLLERLMRGTTDGAILMLPEESADELRMLQRQGFPFVVVDPREAPPEGIACVAAMHAAGAKQATEHLLAARPPADRRDRGRARLVRDRGAAARLPRRARRRRDPARPELVVYSDWRIPRGTQAAERAARRCPTRRPRSSASTTTSRSARCTPRTSAGSRCPRTCSVVGFDDTEQAVIVTPRLTSVRQPLAEMGRMGVSLLIAADRRPARRRAAHGALDDARRPRVDSAARGADDARRGRRGARPRRPRRRRRARARADERASTRIRRATARLRRSGTRAARRPLARECVGLGREPDGAVVDVERGELDEHALLGRRVASSC